jgi:PAS domain S-box-containing protein
VEDTATDPRWEGLRNLALRYNLRACWSEPVFSSSGQVVGTFAMYYCQPRAPTEGELSAIEMGAHLVGVAIEHRRAEQALRESEEKFRGIVELANVGIAIVLDARFRFVNPHWASMLGYTVEEMLGREFMPYCTPEERDRIVDYYRRRTRGEPAPTRYETVMLHKDGTRVYAEVSVGMIPYEGRQATFVFLRDITEQKRVEDALRQSERRFRAVFEGAPIGISVTSLGPQLLETNRALQEMFGYTGEEFYNLAVSEFSHPEDMAVDAALFDELVHGQRDGYQMEKRFIRKNGEMFWGRLSLSLARGDRGEPLFAIATTEDITEHKQAQDALLEAYETLEQRVEERTRQLTTLLAENARLYWAEQSRLAEAERRRLAAEGMREILAALNSKQALDDTLNLIASHACQVLGSDAAALLRLDRATGLLGIQATCNLDAEYAAQIRMPLGVGTAGRALAECRPVVIPDTAEAADYMQAGGLDRPEIVPDLLRQLTGRFRALFSVPIIVKDQAHGAITFYYREPHHFPDEEFRLALSVADQAALAIENARLREQAEQSAAMQERGRLARELHDSVTQSLYSVTMYTEAAARLMPPGNEAATGYLRDAGETAQEALREMRLMIYQLRPPVLEKGGLAVALQVRLDAVERRGGMQAELIVEGEDRLGPAAQAELHQIAQEALNNALKHAHARQVQVHLQFGESVTRLTIQDNGVGFDPAAAQARGGMGLPGMRERAQRIGGRIEIESAPGRGTQVTVEVPIGGSK